MLWLTKNPFRSELCTVLSQYNVDLGCTSRKQQQRLPSRVFFCVVSSGLDLHYTSTENGAGSGSRVAKPILEWRALSYWLPPVKG